MLADEKPAYTRSCKPAALVATFPFSNDIECTVFTVQCKVHLPIGQQIIRLLCVYPFESNYFIIIIRHSGSSVCYPIIENKKHGMGVWKAFRHGYQSLHSYNDPRLLHSLTYGCFRESLPRFSGAAWKTPSSVTLAHDQDLSCFRIDYQGIGCYIKSLRLRHRCHS